MTETMTLSRLGLETQHVCVLLVEDNPADVRLAREDLADERSVQFDLTLTNTLKKAAALLSQGGFDAVLLDLSLPDSQGIETFIELHREFPTVPIVVLSGADDDELGLLAVQSGAQDYLVKGSADGDMLRRSLRYAIGRARAEEALRLSEERYRIVEQATNDAVWDYDLVTGNLWWSRNVEAIFGYRTDEIDPCIDWWEERIHPEDAARARAQLARVLETGDRKWSFEYRFRRADGTYAYVIDRGSTLINAEGRIVRMLGSMMDITSRVEAEQALKVSEERSRTLLQSLPHRVTFKDPDGVYVSVNERFAEDFGCRPDQLVGKTDLELYSREEAERFRRDDLEIMQTRQSASLVETISGKDGIRHVGVVKAPVIHDSGEVIGVLGLFTDVTDRIQNQIALRESEQRLRLAIQSGKMRTWDWNFDTDEIILTGDLEPLFGTSIETVRASFADFLKAVHPDDRETIVSRIDRATVEGGAFHAEFRTIRPDGVEGWAVSNGMVVCGEDGRPERLVGVSVDVTERKRAEAQIRSRSAELQLLYEAGRALGRSLEPGAVFDTMRELVAQSMDCDALIVSEYCQETAEIRCAYAWVEGARISPDQFPPLPMAPEGKGIQSTVIRTGESMLVQDAPAAVEQTTNRYFVNSEGSVMDSPDERSAATQSIIYVPIKLDGKVLGVAQVSSLRPEAYSEEHLRIFEGLTQQLGAAIRNAHLYEQSRLELAERQRAEEAVRVNHQLLSSVIEGITDSIYVKDLKGRYLLINSAGAEMMGSTVDNVIGKTDSSFARGAHLQRVLEHDRLAVTSGAITYESAKEVRGALRHYLTTKAPYYDHKGQVIGVIGISRDITSLKGVEEEIKLRNRQLEALSRRVVAVQELERNQIARELHDEIGQLLTGLRLVIAINKRTPEKAAEAMEKADSLAHELMERVSEMSLNLRPTMLDDLGLVPALQWQFKRFTEQTTIKVHFQQKGVERRFPREVETAAYRIIQEALTNAARYAGVHEVKVRVENAAEGLRIEVKDTGRGFEPEKALAARDSAGLAGMRERATLLGGQWEIRSSPGKGTRVIACLPISEGPGE